MMPGFQRLIERHGLEQASANFHSNGTKHPRAIVQTVEVFPMVSSPATISPGRLGARTSLTVSGNDACNGGQTSGRHAKGDGIPAETRHFQVTPPSRLRKGLSTSISPA
jgi:hypothetical protein